MEQKIHNVSFIAIKPDSEIKKIVFLFHGYAQRASHMINIFGKKVLDALPNTLIISVNGLHECREYVGKRRYDWLRYDGAKWDLDAMHIAATHAFKEIEGFIESQLNEYGLEYKDVMLVGFSQGARICLHVGLRLRECCAGILCFSGALSFPQLLSNEIRVRPKVLLVHGSDDPILSVDESFIACQRLIECGLDARIKVINGLDHKINVSAVKIGKRFLRDCFGF